MLFEVTSNANGFSITDLDVDFDIPALHATPFSYLDGEVPSLKNFTWITPTVVVARGGCAPFRIPNSLPGR